MSPYTLLITLAVVIHHTSGQGGIYGNCTLDQVNKFRSGLSASCNKIFDKASANPSSLTDEDFNIYCDASCIGVFATFQRNNCSNGLLADVLEVECYKDDGDWGGHCYIALVHHQTEDSSLLADVGTTCLPPRTPCNPTCVNDLKDINTHMGCCFMAYFGNSKLVDELTQNKTFTTDMQKFFSQISDATLWSDCNVTPVPACTTKKN